VARDAIDAEGMRRTRSAMHAADVLVVVQDGSVPYDAQVVAETQDRTRLLVRGKSDLPMHPSQAGHDAVSVSALSGAGVDDLITALSRAIGGGIGSEAEENEMAASVRQLALLESTRDALRCSDEALGRVPLEAVLVDLREALLSLAELRGVSVADSVLDTIFANFCIGK